MRISEHEFLEAWFEAHGFEPKDDDQEPEVATDDDGSDSEDEEEAEQEEDVWMKLDARSTYLTFIYGVCVL